jgi:CheY-like chemotaxis protein
MTPEAAVHPGKTGDRAGYPRILLVEDDRPVAKVVRAILERHGVSVTIAENGREAVDRMQQGGIDLVLMDLQMPVMDGLEATRMIRKLEAGTGRRTSVFALTAHAHRKFREECLVAGMDGVLTKPLRPEELLAAIDSCR